MWKKDVVVPARELRSGDVVMDTTGRTLTVRNLNWMANYYHVTTNDPDWSLYLLKDSSIRVLKLWPR